MSRAATSRAPPPSGIQSPQWRPASPHALRERQAAEVRRLLPQWGFAVEDRRLTVEDLLAADHVLLTNSLMGAVPVVSLHDATLGCGSALCDKINEAVFQQA